MASEPLIRRMDARAAIADGNGQFIIDTIDVAQPLGDEVLVEIKAAGICHTDHASLSWKRPLVMGHEGAGIIRAVGPHVTNVREGDRVILNWAIPCGVCFQCARGAPTLCEESKPAYVMEPSKGHARPEGTTWRGRPIDRSFNIGVLSELALVRAPAVTRLPDDVTFQVACIVGCGVMTGYGSAINAAKVEQGSSVAVIGCGGVGLNVIQGARISGAAKIIAIDRRPAALAQARGFGATHTLETDGSESSLSTVASEVKKLTAGRGADYAFEATAVPTLAFFPLSLVRNGGMALQVSGINESVTVPMPMFMWDKKYVTPLYGNCVPERDFPRIFELYAKGALKLNELITRTYSLDQVGEAMNDMLSGRNAKGVVLF